MFQSFSKSLEDQKQASCQEGMQIMASAPKLIPLQPLFLVVVRMKKNDKMNIILTTLH